MGGFAGTDTIRIPKVSAGAEVAGESFVPPLYVMGDYAGYLQLGQNQFLLGDGRSASQRPKRRPSYRERQARHRRAVA